MRQHQELPNPSRFFMQLKCLCVLHFIKVLSKQRMRITAAICFAGGFRVQRAVRRRSERPCTGWAAGYARRDDRLRCSAWNDSENTDTYRDLLDAKIMGRLMARPSDVTAQFRTVQQEQGIIAATRQFYNLCIDSNYIRMDRVAKMNTGGTPARMAILRLPSISKPEKSPKEIAMAKLFASAGLSEMPALPRECRLRRQSQSPGTAKPAHYSVGAKRGTVVFQYSPYVYYNEHCIVFHHDHVPMKLTKETLARLLSFVDAYPHYFLGSNADLPIVGARFSRMIISRRTAYLPDPESTEGGRVCARGLSRCIRGHREVADVGDSAILKRSEFAS